MKKIYKTMLLMLIVILATISVTFFVTNKFHEQELYSASGVLEQVKDISELNTVEMYFNEIIDFNVNHQIVEKEYNELILKSREGTTNADYISFVKDFSLTNNTNLLKKFIISQL